MTRWLVSQRRGGRGWVSRRGRQGDGLVQLCKAPAEDTPPLPFTEEHCLSVSSPPLFLDLGPFPPPSCSCSPRPQHLQPPKKADALRLDSSYRHPPPHIGDCHSFLSLLTPTSSRGSLLAPFISLDFVVFSFCSYSKILSPSRGLMWSAFLMCSVI